MLILPNSTKISSNTDFILNVFFCLFVFLDIDKYCDGIKCYPGSSVAKPNQPDDRSPISQPYPYHHGGRLNQIYFAEMSQMQMQKNLWPGGADQDDGDQCGLPNHQQPEA